MAVSGEEIRTSGKAHVPRGGLAGAFRLTGIAPPRGWVEFNEIVSRGDERGALANLPPAPLMPGPAEAPEAERSGVLRDESKRALGAVLIAAPVAPVLGAILSVLSLVSVLSAPAGRVDLIWPAFGYLAIAWAMLAAVAWALGLSTARGALPGTYGELVQWLVEIRAWLIHLNTLDCGLPSLSARVAFWHLAWQYELIRLDLAENGSRWFVGTGYVNVWRRVHLAQEALVRLVSEDALAAVARIELLRFTGAGIDGSDDALAQLQAALVILDAKQLGNPLKTTTTATTPSDVEQARDVIHVMRGKANQYRDKARSGLARTRSDLTRTLTMTAFLSYALFWIAMEARVGVEAAKLPDQSAQVLGSIAVLQMGTGAIALFLWGALVGLFGQLWTKWSANPDTGEDDFGLGISRLLAEPILAGVAGVCGVVVLTFGGPLLQSGLTGLFADPVKAAENLQNAFLPGSSPASLLYAAIFALSPNLLVSRLQQAGANLQRNLSSSSAGDGGGMSNGASGNK